MSFNKYFHDELASLRELGKEFAERNPRLAPFLAVEGQDPDVERLLEGFAFLTGRLRQKLDDELPELTHSLMTLLWPQFLRPIPAMSIVRFTPRSTLSEKQRIHRGIEVDSCPVDGTDCTFRTCYDIDLHPLEIAGISRLQRPTGASIRIRLRRTAHLRWSDMKLDYLRFFLHGDLQVSQMLYLWLFRYLEGVQVTASTAYGERAIARLDENAVLPVGFADGQQLLPGSPHLPDGFRLIQEYHVLPEKFHFFDVINLACIKSAASQEDSLADADSIDLVFQFSRPLEKHLNIHNDSFQLFCTPVVNLFRHEAVPIRADHKRTEYRVMPAGNDPAHYEIFSIDHVQGWGHQNHHNQTFPSFESFQHFESVALNHQLRFYRERKKPSVSGYGMESYLTFINQSEHDVFPETETVSVELTCSNRHLPALLGVGDISVATSTSPEYTHFSNITPVMPSVTPPLDQGFHWRLIANMSLNYLSLSNIDSLKTVLSIYDYKRHYDRQQALASQHRLDAFEGLYSAQEDRLHQGIPVRGRGTFIRLKESHFANEGDMFLFTSVLNELFALHCSISSFHRLTVHGIETGEIYQWKPRTGALPLV